MQWWNGVSAALESVTLGPQLWEQVEELALIPKLMRDTMQMQMQT